MSKIIIELDSYNLDAAKIAVIKACVTKANSEGGKQQNYIGEQLGLTGSSVSKYIQDNKIEWKRPSSKEAAIASGIAALRNLGYTVTEPTNETKTL